LIAGASDGIFGWNFVSWNDLTDKPATFTSSAHTHSDSELTSISWSKVLSKPTTLSGYGITDASLSTHNHDATYVAKNTAITAGTGTKVTYDAKGLVTSSTSLAATDIPNLSWTKITTDKPTTIQGYGITNAVDSVVFNSHTGDAAVHLTSAQNAFLDLFVTGSDVVLDANITF
jgi:hypothetical protein